MKRLFAAAAVAAVFATPAHAITVVTARPVVITPRVSVIRSYPPRRLFNWRSVWQAIKSRA